MMMMRAGLLKKILGVTKGKIPSFKDFFPLLWMQ